MKKLLLVVMSLVCMLLIAACAGQKEAGEESSRVLKVGLDANFPPFEYYQKGTDNFTGFKEYIVYPYGYTIYKIK